MKTKNLAVTGLVGVLVLALWYQFLFKPMRSQASKAKSDTTAAEAKLVPLQHQLNQAQADAANKKSLDRQLHALQSAVPASPALADFIRDANGIATASGVSWQTVTHAPPIAGADGLDSITVAIQLKGTYGQVVDYITRLAKLRRLVTVDSVQVNSAGGSGSTTGESTGPFSGATQLTVTISGRMFATPPPSAVTGSAGTGAAAASSAAGSAATTG